MTDSVEKRIDDLTNENKHKSLASKMNSLRSKIEARKNMKNHVLLCDVSGSMGGMVHGNDGSDSAINIVQSVVNNFDGASIYVFHSSCERVNGTNLGHPRGGTAMHLAFEQMKRDGHKEVTILTDGEPDNEQAALKSVKGLILNIIYIGPAPTPEFLEKLAKNTGGQFDTVELLNSKGTKTELENKIKGFLGA